MKKKIDMLTQLLEKNGISLLDSSKKREGGSNSEDRERVHALVAGTSSSPSFIIDFGASRHMVSTKEAFTSLDMSKGPPIVLGDDSLTKILGKGRIDLDHGQFRNVLYVPGLASNLLLVYQMTHTGSLCHVPVPHLAKRTRRTSTQPGKQSMKINQRRSMLKLKLKQQA